MSSSARPFLSIVIPAYNEARRLAPGMAQVEKYLRAHGHRAEILVVDDGSHDETADIAAGFDRPELPVRVLRNHRNRGKGYSVRRGMRAARGELRLMTDADQSTHIRELAKALPCVERGADVVIGSRDVPDSDITEHQRWHRRMLGSLLRRVRRRLALGDIRDTQCGFKLFTARAADAIFSRQRDNGFAFDVEVLLLARKLGFEIREIGVQWCNDPDSRVRAFRDPFLMAVALLRIVWRVHWVDGAARERTSP